MSFQTTIIGFFAIARLKTAAVAASLLRKKSWRLRGIRFELRIEGTDKRNKTIIGKDRPVSSLPRPGEGAHRCGVAQIVSNRLHHVRTAMRT
ncbi:hypothetical protein BGZ57DRAFT_908803 [Hyaloscypha finlandica]|nr:hypothetical protein BGZ57DRAFT_908803 [Hyaloscypha finlandica]